MPYYNKLLFIGRDVLKSR